MKQTRYRYIVPGLVLLFSAWVLIVHFSTLPRRFETSNYTHSLPFTLDGKVTFVGPMAYDAGLRVDDRVTSLNGRAAVDESVFIEELSKSRRGDPLLLTIERSSADGGIETASVAIEPVPMPEGISRYLRFGAGLMFSYAMPGFCILLGLWVVFVRPHDYLAWLLMLLLFGLASIGLEGYTGGVVQVFRSVFGSSWSLSMLLFGIYFPEQLKFDRKFPWVKWLFIIPLGFQVAFSVLSQIFGQLGLSMDSINPIYAYYAPISTPINIIAVSLFFTCLGWKSGTSENPDARRRLRLMVVGTMVAMAPSFAIIVYSIVTKARGSFFDVAPSWFAVLALFSMLLFPITMAYVIVVHRAMDVSVVIRQGVQYGLARSGVRVVQLLILLGIGLAVRWTITNYGSDSTTQIAFIVGGVALVPLIDFIAKPLRVWIDKRFFREAYNSEKLLSELSDDVRSIVETGPLLETVATRISDSLHVSRIALMLKVGGKFVPAAMTGYEYQPQADLDSASPIIDELRKGEPLVIYKEDEERLAAFGPDQAVLGVLNSQLLIPIASKNDIVGVISLGPKLSEQPYTPNDIRLLRSVALQAGLALENSRLTEAVAREAAQKERINREIEIAREVQERLFPQDLPKIDGLDYCGSCRPAAGVGGDYYDFFELENGKLGIAIGDVSGKGIGASLMMASLQASLRGQTLHHGDDLSALMSHVNQLVYETSTTNRYATFFYAQYDPSTRRLIYVNAGHNAPYLLREGGKACEILTLNEGGPVVGMLPPMIVEYEQGEITLEPGDVIVGTTDGITEAMDPNENEWGDEAVLAELKSIRHKSPQEMIEHVMAGADRFANGAKQHDDMTIIVVKAI